MIKSTKYYLIFFTFFISSCSSLLDINETFQNFLPSSQNSIYVVQPGDSLWAIALKLNIDQKALISLNNLTEPYVIYPNQKLVISGLNSSNSSIVKNSSKLWNHPLNDDFQGSNTKDGWIIFVQPVGTPIFSIDRGKVEIAGPDIPGYGNLVMISHPNNYLSLYAHCDKIFVEQGDEVSRGTIIAHLGSSESASPLLRFQIRKNGKPIRSDKTDFVF